MKKRKPNPYINWTHCHELARKIYLIDIVIDVTKDKERRQKAMFDLEAMEIELEKNLLGFYSKDEFETWKIERNIRTLQELSEENDECMKVVSFLASEYNFEADLLITEATE